MSSQKWVAIPWEQFDSRSKSETENVPLENVPEKEALSRSAILESVPENCRRNARNILQHIDRSPGIDWDHRGQLLVEGKVVPGTHLCDLVKDASYKYKNWEAEGTNEFYRALAESNLPSGVIRNPGRRSLLETYKHRQPPGIPEHSTGSGDRSTGTADPSKWMMWK